MTDKTTCYKLDESKPETCPANCRVHGKEKEIEVWIKKNIYLDSKTKERRTIILDNRRNQFFFFAEPLDFDKDDQMVARYWLAEIEGWKDEWFDIVEAVYTD